MSSSGGTPFRLALLQSQTDLLSRLNEEHLIKVDAVTFILVIVVLLLQIVIKVDHLFYRLV